VAGSFAAVLLLATVIDPDLFILLEITSRHSEFYYISVFCGILAVARSITPEENRVFDSELFMRAIVQLSSTHITFRTNGGNNHTPIQHTQFKELFPIKAIVFAMELAGVVLMPFIL